MQNTTYHPLYQQNQHIKKDIDGKSNHDVQDIANKMANLCRPDDGDTFKEFSVSKSDPKYQTLPYNTKFTVNLLSSRINKADFGFLNNHCASENKDNESNNVTSSNFNGNLNMQSAHMTVHSAPLNVANKNIATPLNQQDLLSRKVNEVKDQNIISNGNHNVQIEELIPKTNVDNFPPQPLLTTSHSIINSLNLHQVFNFCFSFSSFIFIFPNHSFIRIY